MLPSLVTLLFVHGQEKILLVRHNIILHSRVTEHALRATDGVSADDIM